LQVSDVYHMTVGDRVPLFLSAMAGITDPEYSLEVARSGFVAGVSIGGYDIDSSTHQASLEISKRRKEFTFAPDNLFTAINTGLTEILKFSSCFINLRAVNGEFLPLFCEQISNLASSSVWKPVIEINAHCGQPEMVKCGAGVTLASDVHKLAKLIQIIGSSGLISCIKFKVAISEKKPFHAAKFRSNLNFLVKRGLNIAHIDSYTIGGTINYSPLEVAAGIPGLLVIGNNSVSKADDCKKILGTGARGFSLAREYLRDRWVFRTIYQALS